MKLKAVITAAGFALGTSQRIFFMRLRMKEYGKVFSNRAIAELDHFVWRRAHDDVIAVFNRQPEELVSHGTAHCVNFHFLRQPKRESA
jgi:hypothetical protein